MLFFFYLCGMLPQSGSNRQYIREEGPNGKTQIRVIGTSKDENNAFITLARHFRSKGLHVPEVYSVSADGMEYTQEDLGDTLLYEAIAQGRASGSFSDNEIALLIKTIRQLAHIQTEGAQGLDWSVCYPVAEFDRRSVMWDLNYFKYCFLKLQGLDFSEPMLEDDFDQMAETLLSEPAETFLYRDCQSRNVMVKDGEPWFIDFQGGRRGPVYYDLASFLWQAKARFPQSLRDQLIAEYIDELKYINAACSICFNREALPHFVLFRTLQVLGAYGFRGLIEKKQHFIESIPFAKENLRGLFDTYPVLAHDYPYIHQIALQL